LDAVVKYAILGPVELCDSDRRVAVGGPRQLALLALLLLHANRVVSNDRLIDTLWNDRDRAGALKCLQAVILRLRRTLDADAGHGESVLRTVAGGYLLTVPPGELDAEVFQTRVEEGRHALAGGEAKRARDVLREALGMWRGPALAEVAYEEFAQTEIRRLEELRMAALQSRVDCDLQLGEHGGLIGELDALVAVHPGRERLAAQLMLALYRCGRQGDALAVYARTRAYLSGELGVEPGPALRDLQAEVLAQSPALQWVGDPPGCAATAAVSAVQAAVRPIGVVTFLLTGIEASSRMSEADADAIAAALEFHEGLITRLVERHGGRLLKAKGEGDSTLSVFQRASAAVACAAELQHALVTAAEDNLPLGLRLRLALHTGEAQEHGGDYFGPVLDRAARLRSLAAGDVTVVSQTTAELVRDRLPRGLALLDVGRHVLHGGSQPEPVFELHASAATSDSGSAVAAGPVVLALPRSLHGPAASPFVGRDAELEALRECWRQVCGGTRATVVIGGEPGIGKTRLASELARAVHGQGTLVLHGRCDEGLAVPYQPFVEALRPYARAVGLDRLRAELGDLAPDLGRLLPELASLGEPVRADPESERFALFEAIAALIEAMTREQPALFVLDDLHWAARPTLLLLRHLIRSERRLGVLLLGTHRDTELDADHLLPPLLADLHRDASVQLLSIGGLDEAAITALLQAAIGPALGERAAELAHVLGDQTTGNPFFIRELLAHVVESATCSVGGERLRLGVTVAQLEAPERLRHVILQRVARLSAPARRALSVAAVAGATFSFVLLERVLGEGSGVLDALDEAVAAGLLTEAGHGEHAFAHALVRQTIYRQMGSARRMRLHRQLGEAMEALGGARAQVEALAYHFAQAAADGQGVKAAAYAMAAGRSATARLGYEEAAAHYERGLQALTLTGQPQQQRRCELLLALGQVRWGAGELDTARQVYGQAAELADKLGDATRLAHAAIGFCGPQRFEVAAAVIQAIVGLLQRALAALDDNDSALRARLMGRLAAALACTCVEGRKPVLAHQALQMARRVGDKATLADVLASTHWAIRDPDTVHESIALAEELGRVADDLGDRRLRALAHAWLLDYLLELGDIDAFERELEALQRLTQTRKEHYFQWILAARLANHAHLRGHLEHCDTLAHEALAHRFKGHDENAAHIFLVQMLVVRREQGRLDELVETVESFAAQHPQLVTWRCALAYIDGQLGRTAQARQKLETLAHADFSDIPRDGFWLSNVSTLCEIAVFLGDARRTQLLYKLLLPYADRCATSFALLCQGSVSRPLGQLATTMSRFDDAERHFEQALTMNTQIRSPLWIGHTQHDYAHMLLLRNRPGDHDKALELLTDALAVAEQLGLKVLTDKARLLSLAAKAAASPAAVPKPA
jgi:DNA-binding SARP family transcriptional activator/class 3 adenylate cyclase/tetratricopeptide (TPR) repeat protein